MSDIETQSTPAVAGRSVSTASAGSHAQAGTNSEGHEPAPQLGGWLNRLRDAFGLKASPTLREDLEQALSREDAIDAVFSPEERAMLRNILHLREQRVDDIMIPRADIAAVEEGATLADLLIAFQTSGHSRMPVYRETLDEPLGMVHIKDLMAHVTARALASHRAAIEEQTPTNGAGPDGAGLNGADAMDVGGVDLYVTLADAGLIRPVLFVPPSMRAAELLTKMQAARIQIALVIDEYGGTDGLLSLEDIVETIVGDIEDEYDPEEEPAVVRISDGIFEAEARASLEEVASVVGSDFSTEDWGDDVDTVGGLIFTLLGRIPATGEVVASTELPGFRIEVLEADPRLIRRVRIHRDGSVGAADRDRAVPADLLDD